MAGSSTSSESWKLASFLDYQTPRTFKKLHEQVIEQERRQYERKQRLEKISDRLLGSNSSNIQVLGQRSKALEEAIQTIEEAQVENEARATKIAAQQKKISESLAKLPGAKPEVVFEASFFRFLEASLRELIAEYRESVRVRVESDASNMFLNLVRDAEGYGGIRIESDFAVELLDTRGEPRPTSEGGKQLLALALIGALKRACGSRQAGCD